jgi:hypothetical protein
VLAAIVMRVAAGVRGAWPALRSTRSSCIIGALWQRGDTCPAFGAD